MDFGKVILVLKREYLTRVRAKSFILSTILTPIALLGVGALMVWLMTSDTDTKKSVGIFDETGVLVERMIELNEERYSNVSSLEIDSVKAMVQREELDAYLLLQEKHI